MTMTSVRKAANKCCAAYISFTETIEVLIGCHITLYCGPVLKAVNRYLSFDVYRSA